MMMMKKKMMLLIMIVVVVGTRVFRLPYQYFSAMLHQYNAHTEIKPITSEKTLKRAEGRKWGGGEGACVWKGGGGVEKAPTIYAPTIYDTRICYVL